MGIWHDWTALLAHALEQITSQFGVTEAMAIILLTFMVRAVLMPITLTSAVRMEANKQKMKLLKPELDALKLHYKDDPKKLANETLEFYRQHKIRLLDRLAIASVGTQSVFGMGLFQALNRAAFSSKFLWIGNLGKPDLLLTLLVGAIMLLGMALAPGAFHEPNMLVIMGVAVVVTAVGTLALPSAVGIYWATSNVASIVQTLLLRVVVRRRSAMGL